MIKSKKGIKTEIDILNSGKALFHEKGYAKTSMRDICAHADVKLGTLTYYFNKKDDLARRIYADHVIRIYSFIKSNKTKPINSIQLNFYMTCLYQYFYSIDKKTNDFQLETIYHRDIYDSIHQQLFNRLYKTYYSLVSENFSQSELETALFADISVRRELAIRFLRKEYPKDSRDLFTDMYTITGRLFKFPEEITQLYIREAIDFLDTHDCSSIRLLI